MTQPENHWNIWRIKNRWLRAFAVALIGTPLLAAVVAAVALLSIVVGMGEGAVHAWSMFWRERDVAYVGKNWWRAVTLREAP